MKKILIISAIAIAACAPEADLDGDALVISDPTFRAPFPGRSVAAAYMRIDNDGLADRLVAVSTPISERVELHTHTMEDGVMKMRRLEDGIPLPENGATVLEQGGLHVMIFDVDGSAVEDTVPLTLDFESAPDVTVIAEVVRD